MPELRCKKCDEVIKSIYLTRVYDFSDSNCNEAKHTIAFPGELYKAYPYYCARCGAPIDVSIVFQETE